MKKASILLLSLFCLTASCKKSAGSGSSDNSSVPAPYYFRCTVEGAVQNFISTYQCSLSQINIPLAGTTLPSYSVFLLQAGVNAINAPFLQINASESGSFGTGPANYSSATSTLTFIYSPNAANIGNPVYVGGGLSAYTVLLNITSVDNTTIKGTFSGYVSGGDANASVKTVKPLTNGEFYMPLKRE